MRNRIIRITAPHFVVGIETYCGPLRRRKGGMSVPSHRCAPIVKYMKGWTVGEIMRYCRKKGWLYELEGGPRMKKFKRVRGVYVNGYAKKIRGN